MCSSHQIGMLETGGYVAVQDYHNYTHLAMSNSESAGRDSDELDEAVATLASISRILRVPLSRVGLHCY